MARQFKQQEDSTWYTKGKPCTEHTYSRWSGDAGLQTALTRVAEAGLRLRWRGAIPP